MLLSNCGIGGKRKSMFIKNKELYETFALKKFKMNKINNKFLLTEDKFMPELHLKQPGFTDGACESFTKYRERIKRFRETGNLKLLKRNQLDRACFAHNAAYSNSKDIAKRTISDKTLKVRADEIV